MDVAKTQLANHFSDSGNSANDQKQDEDSLGGRIKISELSFNQLTTPVDPTSKPSNEIQQVFTSELL